MVESEHCRSRASPISLLVVPVRVSSLINQGIVIQITAQNSIGQIYAGRLVLGFAGGMGSVVGPIYLAEIAPKSIRGACGIFHGMSIYVGIVIGYFANYGAALNISDRSDAQWRVPLSLAVVFPTMMLIMSLWVPQSPRWLVKQGKTQQARQVICRLRGMPEEDPYVVTELKGIEDQLEWEEAMTMGTSGFWAPVKELFTVPDMRYRLLLSFGLGAAGQWYVTAT